MTEENELPDGPYFNIDIAESGEGDQRRVQVNVEQNLTEASDLLRDLAQAAQAAISQRLMQLDTDREQRVAQQREQNHDRPIRH